MNKKEYFIESSLSGMYMHYNEFAIIFSEDKNHTDLIPLNFIINNKKFNDFAIYFDEQNSHNCLNAKFLSVEIDPEYWRF